MKTKLLIAFAFCTFNLFSQTNLIPNGGFETWTNSTTLSNWTIENSVTQNTFLPAKGSYSANLSLTSSLIPKISIPVSLVAGTTYIVKYKYKYLNTNFGGTHPITLSIQNGGNTSLTSSSFASNNSWTQKQITFTADQTIAYDLSISINSFDTEFFGVSIDEVQIYAESDEQYTLIPDPKFEDELIYQLLDSGPRDGRVVTSNISELASLDVSFLNIANLTGIQDFVGLKTLNCSFNNLTSLNLSKNLLLQELNVKNCKLASLDLSKNVALKKINCQYNQLTSLNVKNGNNTLLTSQDLFFKFNKNLTCIQVDDVTYSNTNWSTQKEATAEFNTSCAPFTLIPDVNFEKKLIALGIDSGATDGRVLTSTISSLTFLDVTSSNIADFTGIQDFVGLQALHCGDNQLSTIDVTKNILLTYLNCYSNKLTSLNVSKNKDLKFFGCSSNQLSSLDISENIKLTHLYCNDNQLTSLDVSKHVTLTTLYCSDNNLSSLNLKNGKNTLLSIPYSLNNPNLKCILVDDVTYSNTNWADKKDTTATYSNSCDTQQFTVIPDVNFEKKLIELGIDKDGINGKVATESINSVISLNISNSNITDLTGIESFTALKYFSCTTNKITSVDFSKNLMLENLAIGENNLTSLEVSKNTKLHTLSFSRNQISSIDLSQNTNLSRLGFNYNKLTEINLTYNNLTELHCRTNNLTSINLTNQPNLVFLECGVNKTVSLDLSANKKLEELHCEFMELTNLNLSENKELILLNAFGNQLTNLDLSKNSKLTSLYCDENKLVKLNVKNGNNTNITTFMATNNPNLSCIQVDDANYASGASTFFKDATATYSSTCSTLGIEDSIFDKVSIYPNPTKGELHIDNIVVEKATIYDALGKLVKTATFNSGANNNTIHLAGLPKGIYYVYLESEGANTAKKIIVE